MYVHILGNFGEKMSVDFYPKLEFKKKSFSNTIRVFTPDPDSNSLQRLFADNTR